LISYQIHFFESCRRKAPLVRDKVPFSWTSVSTIQESHCLLQFQPHQIIIGRDIQHALILIEGAVRSRLAGFDGAQVLGLPVKDQDAAGAGGKQVALVVYF
jgi:hypothetical protein